MYFISIFISIIVAIPLLFLLFLALWDMRKNVVLLIGSALLLLFLTAIVIFET